MEYGFGFLEARSAVVFNPNIKPSSREHRRSLRLLSRELLQYGLPAKKTGEVDNVASRRRKIAKFFEMFSMRRKVSADEIGVEREILA